jgi:hypothetical protein
LAYSSLRTPSLRHAAVERAKRIRFLVGEIEPRSPKASDNENRSGRLRRSGVSPDCLAPRAGRRKLTGCA